MNQLKLKFNLKGMLEYVLMLVVFLFGQSVYIRMIDSDYRYVYFDIALIIILLLLLCIEGHLSLKALRNAVVLTSILLIYFAITRIGRITFIYNVCIPFFFLYVYCFEQWNQQRMDTLLKKFSDITIAFSLISILLYMFGTCLNLLPVNVDFYYWKGVMTSSENYFHLMYEAQTQDFFGVEFVRNCGVFCEAPSYAVPLLFSMAYELYVPNKISKLRLSILLAAIITSFSTKALIIALVAIALKLALYTYGRRYIYRGKTASGGVFRSLLKLMMPLLIVVLSIVGFLIFDQKTDSGSYIVRMDNIAACWKAFLSHKLFGVGVGNETALANYVTIYLEWQGFAMGLPVLLAEGGIYLISFYGMAFIHAIIHTNRKSEMICFEIILILVMFTSNIPFFLSIVFILAMQYSVPNKLMIKS